MSKFDFNDLWHYNKQYSEATTLANKYVKSYRGINKGYSALLADHAEHPIEGIKDLSVWNLAVYLHNLEPHLEYSIEVEKSYKTQEDTNT